MFAASAARSAETITARKDAVEGFAVASDERIEAYILFSKDGAGAEILSLRTFIEDGGVRLEQLVSRLGEGTLRFPKVHHDELSKDCLKGLGFRPAGGHLVYGARARSA